MRDAWERCRVLLLAREQERCDRVASMSKLIEQISALVKDQPSKAVPAAQVQALLAGKGRVEHLQALADEFGMVLRLERQAKPKRDDRG